MQMIITDETQCLQFDEISLGMICGLRNEAPAASKFSLKVAGIRAESAC